MRLYYTSEHRVWCETEDEEDGDFHVISGTIRVEDIWSPNSRPKVLATLIVKDREQMPEVQGDGEALAFALLGKAWGIKLLERLMPRNN